MYAVTPEKSINRSKSASFTRHQLSTSIFHHHGASLAFQSTASARSESETSLTMRSTTLSGYAVQCSKSTWTKSPPSSSPTAHETRMHSKEAQTALHTVSLPIDAFNVVSKAQAFKNAGTKRLFWIGFGPQWDLPYVVLLPSHLRVSNTTVTCSP